MKYRSGKRNIKKAAAPIATAVFVIVAALFVWDVWIRNDAQELSADCIAKQRNHRASER